ncbi:serine/threonine-protein kinase [Streptomyces sp. TRM68416]|uniref:serine/threonine-protein kinase n=1 Tax=Streptomyces sp. TRM68416 TaxID=2758412 RepID=UPI00166210B2|nr:serine/threonine-protein kinase [Streptomyces sp. TRM68416]MBD0842466.1 serine/threonine protein kinase [Streptomyces sp. TRM68416]
MPEHVAGLPGFEDWGELRKIGSGSWADVYAGLDPEAGETRAVKVMRFDGGEPDPYAAALFGRETGICLALVHPNVVRVHRTGESGGLPCLVMEYCGLGSLEDRVTGHGPLSVAEAVPLFLDLLDGLAYAHHAPLATVDAQGQPVTVHGIVHRDVKPSNILLARGPDRTTAKLADFTLAKACEAAGLISITRTGDYGGTPAFMPRAQALDYKRATRGVDVWGVAASLYLALTGRAPRDLPPDRDLQLAVLETPLVPLADRGTPVPKALADLVDDTLRADLVPPTVSAADLRAALAAFG